MKKSIIAMLVCAAMLAVVAGVGFAASVEEIAAPRYGDQTLWTYTADTLDTHCMTSSAAAASTADISVASAFTYVIDNRFYTGGNATHDISAMGNADDIEAQAVSTYCRYVLAIDTSGDVDVFLGTPAKTSALALYPAVDEGVCPFCSVLVATNSTATFTLGTTALSGAGATATIENLYALPSQAIDR